MITLYDELQEKHQALLGDVQREIPPLPGKVQREISPELRDYFLERIGSLIENVVDAGGFISNGRQREKLRDLLRFWGTWIYDQTGEYPQSQLRPFKAENRGSRRTMLLISASTLFLVGIIIIAVLLLSDTSILQHSATSTQMIAVSAPTILPQHTCPVDFWSGAQPAVFRWRRQMDARQAILEIIQSGNQPPNILELHVELDGQDETKNAGEAFIDLRYDFPKGLRAPLNLEDELITIAVYVPSMAAGTDQHPNGVQIFVKSQSNPDDSYKSEYGTWLNLTNNTDRWLELSLTPARISPQDGKMDPDFDPANIVLVGITIATQKGADVNYSGPIWISDVCW